jgi:hypothetical protein
VKKGWIMVFLSCNAKAKGVWHKCVTRESVSEKIVLKLMGSLITTSVSICKCIIVQVIVP